MSEIYHVELDRIVITGARHLDANASELRSLLDSAVRREVASVQLPAGRTARASVSIDAPSLSGAPAVAAAAAAGVTRALREAR